ncbi:hypothetical protein Bxe_B1740 [Paraburkholderia xenovorans LB400]|uniref:Uncharacterized protein n=1 Tax=Paraburkholderia xenovorans (strain LB400) TaxID=266265 RepID=Q13NW3_PARXL|nr:hypothetical protein Bxe_B1740 [Paraburkholderia xenovorans LB400]
MHAGTDGRSLRACKAASNQIDQLESNEHVKFTCGRPLASGLACVPRLPVVPVGANQVWSLAGTACAEMAGLPGMDSPCQEYRFPGGHADNLRHEQRWVIHGYAAGITLQRVSRAYPYASFSCPVQSTF